jgi:hypothetical protein
MKCDCPPVECNMSVWVSIDETYTSPPGAKFTLYWNGGDACSGFSQGGTVRLYCSNVSDNYSAHTTISGKSGSWSSTGFFSSGCDPSNISGSWDPD